MWPCLKPSFTRIKERIPEWLKWVKNNQERPLKRLEISDSPIMNSIGIIFFFMRRASLVENLKHFLYYEHNKDFLPPAQFTDRIIIIEVWVLLIIWVLAIPQIGILQPTFYRKYGHICEMTAILSFVWLSIQTCQTTIYHLIWKTAIEEHFRSNAHNLHRNLFLAIIGHLKVSYLFGLTYWFGFSNRLGNHFDKPIYELWDAVYFSFVTSTTLGFGDIAPNPATYSTNVKTIILLQIIVSMLMFGVIIARAVSLIEPIKDSKNKPHRRPYEMRRSKLSRLRRYKISK